MARLAREVRLKISQVRRQRWRHHNGKGLPALIKMGFVRCNQLLQLLFDGRPQFTVNAGA